tara:strand:- start:168 stop:305 length:138 start_codon:yes stop_codon:yes gene_type:complete
MMFDVVNTFEVIDTSKGRMISIAIGNPTLVDVLVFLCSFLNDFII